MMPRPSSHRTAGTVSRSSDTSSQGPPFGAGSGTLGRKGGPEHAASAFDRLLALVLDDTHCPTARTGPDRLDDAADARRKAVEHSLGGPAAPPRAP